ncbi:MAG: hypothetical protein IK000_05895 [Bacteroidaceae bacterium]|nr:hypothetical protein [Bacteroidaceae bacterium]
MKKTYILGFVAAALALCSCEIVLPIVDYVSASMIVRITDDSGTNLLDTTQAGNLFEKGMGLLKTSLDTEGESIQTSEEYRTRTLYVSTRAYMGPWAGAVLTKDEKGEAVLFIGEFNEHEERNKELMMEFADGRFVNITYTHKATLTGLSTRARVTDSSEGLNAKVKFSTDYSTGYLNNLLQSDF